MKRISNINMEQINAGGRVCDFIAGGMAGWGVAGLLVGGFVAASSGGAALILAGLVVGAYCAR